MDARMQSSQTITGQYQTWDYYVADGIVPILEGTLEESQSATMAAFIQRGTIPQLPEIGVQWVEYFMSEVPFNEIDNQIKNNLNLLSLIDYYPTYDFINDQLVAKVGI